jgi:hypothetical protein
MVSMSAQITRARDTRTGNEARARKQRDSTGLRQGPFRPRIASVRRYMFHSPFPLCVHLKPLLVAVWFLRTKQGAAATAKGHSNQRTAKDSDTPRNRREGEERQQRKKHLDLHTPPSPPPFNSPGFAVAPSPLQAARTTKSAQGAAKEPRTRTARTQRSLRCVFTYPFVVLCESRQGL